MKYTVTLEITSNAAVGEGDQTIWDIDEIKQMFSDDAVYLSKTQTTRLIPVFGAFKIILVSVEAKKA